MGSTSRNRYCCARTKSSSERFVQIQRSAASHRCESCRDRAGASPHKPRSAVPQVPAADPVAGRRSRCSPPAAISIYFSYQENKSALASLQHEKALAAASRIEQYIRQIEQQLAYAALPQLDASDVELRRIEFLKLLRQAPEVTDIAQLDADGREQIAVSRLGMDSVDSGKDRSQEPAFRNAKRGQPWFGPVYFRKETEPYMTIAIRSGGDNGPGDGRRRQPQVHLGRRVAHQDRRQGQGLRRRRQRLPDRRPGHRPGAAQDQPVASCRTSRPRIEARSADAPAMLSTDLAGTEVLTSVAPIEPLRLERLRRAAGRRGVRRS